MNELKLSKLDNRLSRDTTVPKKDNAATELRYKRDLYTKFLNKSCLIRQHGLAFDNLSHYSLDLKNIDQEIWYKNYLILL